MNAARAKVRGGLLMMVVGVATCVVYSTARAQEERFPLPPREWPAPVEDEKIYTFVLLDRLEYRRGENADARSWDAQAWVGGDYQKLWLKTEGADRIGEGTERAEVQALYARLISPFWYAQTGLRYDSRPAPSRRFAVLGVQGLAPYGFDIEAALFLSDDGASARLKAEYDLLLTQRWILQPRFETNASASRIESRRIGKGVNDIVLGLRLRYEIKREIAPYVGVEWTRVLGQTANLAREAGDDVDELAVIAGIRLWF